MNINSNYTIRLGNRNIVKIMKGSTVIWEKSTTPVVTTDYLYVQNTSSGAIDIVLTKAETSANTKTLEYSKDLSNWTSFTPTDSRFAVSLNQNEKLYLRGSNGTRPNLTIWGQANHITGGNVNTLLDYTNPNGVSLPQNSFKSLFNGDLYLTDASNLVLPATTLVNNCYSYMFYMCTALTATPTLPATTLAQNCYYNMFAECTSLTTARVLPATTLAEGCYYFMFYHCTSLTTAPTLPAPTLVSQCYQQMFSKCTSLNSVTTYAEDISATDCLTNWLSNVAATGTFYNNGSATYTVDSASGIPVGWTEVKPSTGETYFYIENVDSRPGDVRIKFNGAPSYDTIQQIEWSKDRNNWTSVTLTANTTNNVPLNIGEKVYFRNSNGFCSNSQSNYLNFTSDVRHKVGGQLYTLLDYTNENVSLPQYAFYGLFKGDTGLVNASDLVLGWTILSSYCYTNMFYNCRNMTTSPTLPATTLAQDCYTSMFQNCTSLTDAPALPATTLAVSCYKSMFYHCTSLTSTPTLPATTLAQDCYREMFRGCTALTTAPSLPATTLANNCYSSMFSGCTSLTSTPTLPATTLANSCYREMFRACTALTTAPSLPATTLAEGCYYFMFYHCTSLTTAPTLPAPTLVSQCYQQMFSKCTSLNSVTTYAEDISATDCLLEWLSNVSSTGTFYKLGSAYYPSGSSGIPTGWIVKTTPPN